MDIPTQPTVIFHSCSYLIRDTCFREKRFHSPLLLLASVRESSLLYTRGSCNLIPKYRHQFSLVKSPVRWSLTHYISRCMFITYLCTKSPPPVAVTNGSTPPPTDYFRPEDTDSREHSGSPRTVSRSYYLFLLLL